MTFEEIKRNDDINTYIEYADKYLEKIGYTEHSFKHVNKCVSVASYILTELGYDQETIELAKIAAYMHDIGNVINRDDHAQSGAVMSFRILDKLGMDPLSISKIISAIGNHDEKTGLPISTISAALIIADKTDVRRSRTRNIDDNNDIHSRVNYAVTKSDVIIDKDSMELILNLTIDTDVCPIIEYFEIFLDRMKMCKKATEFFGLRFRLIINNKSLL